jgi:hypothetical protein
MMNQDRIQNISAKAILKSPPPSGRPVLSSVVGEREGRIEPTTGNRFFYPPSTDVSHDVSQLPLRRPLPPAVIRPKRPNHVLHLRFELLRLRLKRMQHELRDYNQQKRQQYEAATKKEMTSAPPRPNVAPTALDLSCSAGEILRSAATKGL